LTAVVLGIVFALWPIVALMGGLGFAPLTGLAALATSPISIPRIRIRNYMIVLAAFLAYAAASVFWSPQPLALIDIEKLSVRSEVLRVGLLLLAGGALIAATNVLTDKGRRRIGKVAAVALLVQLVIVGVLAVFEKQAIELAYGNRPDDEGVQNISRNSLIMAVAVPFLVFGLVEGRGRVVALIIGAFTVVAMAAILIMREVDAGILAIALMLVFYGIVRFFRRDGFRIIGGLIALAVMTAPFVFGFISAGANAITATNSMQYRQAIWQRVLEIFWEKPIFGSGVGVLRTHREMIPEGVFANQYYVPNHAHNMLLQLWVETGLVGAMLVSAAVMLAALRLPRPDALGASAPRIAAVAGGAVASWVSFDLWNEWWWAVLSLLGVLAAVKYSPRPAEAAG
jgi:O-antigen ligase